ncbi:MAG TPA: ATP-dependent DNA helicase RecQ [Puia sp.]|nr:ATP-dependent DNA helicase RecQ [Puia sp.]
MKQSSLDILKQYFKHDFFRPLQEDIIDAVLQKKDVLAILPTGGGKSICFQVPALMNEGMCLVISPLIALMKDQVENLRRKGITAFAIYSGMSRKEVTNTLKVAGQSNCKFLYVSPERLETNLFKEFLPSLEINLIAVDEAHCISQWGYDFRPQYLRIGALREELHHVPVLALTATATMEVQNDICERLVIAQKNIFRQSFERANLSYSVFNVDVKFNKIKEILEKVSGAGIVYCKSRMRTKEMADWLNARHINSDYYHAGLTRDERNKKQEAWIKNETRVMVCTNAFGMGIDKPDVRTVIHADVPDCLENYYQEAGRAGRDQKKAYAVLLYSEKELVSLKLMPGVHFPTLQHIQLVYQAVMNYLQIASGRGEGNYYDFDKADFIKKFKLDSLLVNHSLQALEQEELLSYNEQVFLPSKVMFTVNKSGLYDFEHANADLEPLIETVLRTYPGIFDQLVGIQEKSISYLMRRDLNETVRDLKKLHAAGIIQYFPQKDSPQLYLIQNRIKTEDLLIDQTNYHKRKEQYKRRIASILEYVKKDSSCRSMYIANYFGDENATPCGVCDNCLRQKNNHIPPQEFESIYQKIVGVVESNSVEETQLIKKLSGINREKAWKVINHLRAENKLVVDQNGMVRMK